MTDYPKNDWRNAVPQSDKYDRDALIALRIDLSSRDVTQKDIDYVSNLDPQSLSAYLNLLIAWDKQFGDSQQLEKVEEPKDLKERIQHRLDRLETFMKENKRDEAVALVPEISKFWSVLSQQDIEFIQCVRIAIDEGIDWKVS
jgi:hypothetical protein